MTQNRGSDSLWSKFTENKRVIAPSTRRGTPIRPLLADRFDDSGKRVDINEDQENIFIGSGNRMP